MVSYEVILPDIQSESSSGHFLSKNPAYLIDLLQACYKCIRLPLRARTKNISEYCCKSGTSALG